MLKFCSKYIFLLGFFYLKLFICPSDVKKQKSFRAFTPWTPHQDSTMNPLQSLQHLESLTCILQQ